MQRKAVEVAEIFQEIGERDEPGQLLEPGGQHADGIVEAAEQEHQVGEGPGRHFGPLAEAQHQGQDQGADDGGVDDHARQEGGQGARARDGKAPCRRG